MLIRVEGRQPLNGTYRPSGNANAALALIAAALLTDQPVTLHNVPKTASTHAAISAASAMSVSVTWTDEATLTIKADQLTRRVLTHEDTDVSLGTMLLVAPLLVRRQVARLELDFPLNRIRPHLEALRDLGLDVVNSSDAVEIKAATWEKRDIILTQASVTATAIIMLLAARLGKETVIYNAACEPHVQELAHMLTAMGARVDGIGSNLLRIFGVPELSGTECTVGADHIEAASIAAMAALTGGRVQIDGIRGRDMRAIAKIYWRLGIQLDIDESTIFVPRHEKLNVSNREEDVDSSIETAPWPGFPSDLVAVATVIATQARGTSLIHEKLFANRLLFVDKLKAMGAQIVLCDPHRAIVVGPTPLRSVYMDTPDVRAGLGLLAAALAADGISNIDNANVIEHTFAGVIGKLQALNAKITVE
ncbi:MAG: UDP-N-acetylglucosamine 1-carboxyvinyltransferase [Chloroflexi bacterium]|uniref:UDP-N-acetylglucosamine 1-carboxyvinyltransferase n=1 Tax=Candidatus Flexifilum breve TaxID=3140694 RepID=UPI003134F19C|nr:UDP-N-acetylglucosamine 1-carboxyvinyltransferase [Chloroflexota bacterium]